MGSPQRKIIIGTLLGDACLERNGKHVRLKIEHSAKQRIYIEWKYNHLRYLGGKITFRKRFDNRTSKYYESYTFRSHSRPELEEFFELFYLGNIKQVPSQLPKIITPLTLAIWIMDDGYKRNDCNAIRLNTQSYSLEEHVIIQTALLSLGIQSQIQKHKDTFVTYIPSRSMDYLGNLVSNLLINEMRYKIA